MDIFLSYSSADHNVVENIARKLRDGNLEPFLDRWHLAPGMRWRPKLEQTLSVCKAVAIFVGPGEMGSWQQREVDVALDLQARNPKLPVIPVLLPGCEPPLGFLRQLTWVDLRTQTLDRGIVILAKAARGEPPGPEIQTDSDLVRASICPYRGLLHFREEDAPFFFGREAAIDKLADAVQRQPFVAVVGASGSGKSSVVRSGLVPRLRSDRCTAWETVILVPTDEPLKALAKALVPLLEPTMGEIDRLVEAAKLAKHLRSTTISLTDIIGRVLEKQSGTDRMMIVVDQFEELYTLTSDEEARRRFVDELLAASSRAGSKANITLTLRGDFVGKALAYRPLSDRLQDAQINLGPMTREELECAIRKPAEKIQLEFESGLVRRILYDVGEEPGNLPLLEFMLKELWESRRGGLLLNETYDSIGGLQGAVATKADELFKSLSPAEQKILQRVFLCIVRPSESGEDTRRRATFTELPPEGAELVVKLANERLLVTNQSTNGLEQTVEVAHEALISNWGTLRSWVNEDREFLLWRARVDVWLREWERAKESAEALLRGSILIEAQKWFDLRSQDLSDQERKYISASRSLREHLARKEKERQEREIEAAQRLARAEAERADAVEERLRAEAERADQAEKRGRFLQFSLRSAAIAGCCTLFSVILMMGATVFRYPPPLQYWTFKVLLALAAGAAVVLIVEFFIIIQTKARAGAAVGVFSLVLIFSPVDWVSHQLTNDGLVSWWKADGHPEDEEKRNTTKVFGNVTYEKGQSGQAFGMRNDGSFIFATTNGFPIYNRDRTLEFWVLLNSVFPDDRSSWDQMFIVGYGNFGKRHQACECFYMPNSGLGFSNWEEGLNSMELLNPGKWYYVVVTTTAIRCELYIDGQTVDHRHLNMETPTATTFYIGGVPAEMIKAVHKNSGWPVTNLDGRIAGVKIYDRALSAAEIKARYQRQ